MEKKESSEMNKKRSALREQIASIDWGPF